MGYNFQAARVARTARRLTETKITDFTKYQAPVWLKAVEEIPPSEILVRPYPIQHSASNPRARKPKNIFRPTRIVYPEDQLRRDFFKDHPWELARPRMVREKNGQDARLKDWSKGLRQPGMALSGECVVQRQLWLMENKNLSKQEAYDMARHEFYKLRQQDEIESRIAIEEARMVGGYFGKNRIQVGLEVEDMEFEHWKEWATKNIKRMGDEFEQSRALENPVGDEDALDTLEGLGAGTPAAPAPAL
ncbi:mitochondrial ribosomal protein S25-domain-containing protein [Rhypophila decipiens]|uniref:37S ribosomal protein S25, mitochondrial n=1 Tax=Rhypophila decipiens TaxID=261697 RepID=A0AAN6YBK6_9PEZI|nr:mitochondrial ribosomal protein S25-domain-containing protein [Rhypophila decipiens]